MKRIRIAALVLLLVLMLGSCSAGNGEIIIYVDPSYLRHEVDDITEYLNPDAPFVLVNGSVIHKNRSYYWSGRPHYYTNILRTVGSSVGALRSVCGVEDCIHNTGDTERNRFCDLYYLETDLRIDDEGYVYGVYIDSQEFISVRRYNIYTGSGNVIYEPEEALGEERRTAAISNVYLYDNEYIYFFEHMTSGKVNLMRYTFIGRIIENLTPDGLPETPQSLDIYDRHIYILSESGLYGWDLNMTDTSMRRIFSTASNESPVNGKVIRNIQFDRYMNNIYFIACFPGEEYGDLYKVRAYGDSYRRVRKTALTGIVDYQLTEDAVYYTRYDPILRYVGRESYYDVESEGGYPYNTPPEYIEYYDYSGGKFYKLPYTDINRERVVEHQLVFETDENTWLGNWTVIDRYLYGQRFCLIPDHPVSNGYTQSIYYDYILEPVQCLRADLVDGSVSELTELPISVMIEHSLDEYYAVFAVDKSSINQYFEGERHILTPDADYESPYSYQVDRADQGDGIIITNFRQGREIEEITVSPHLAPGRYRFTDIDTGTSFEMNMNEGAVLTVALDTDKTILTTVLYYERIGA
ncbi:MAG: hypothetical protein IJA85_05340 [Clostridia bacterium]|nr:hypothetical protein [Clostridia bacterium]